jgi:hypothetical protein
MGHHIDQGMKYPTLNNILALSGADMEQLTGALRHMIQLCYGHRHWALTPYDRKNRATLYKLVNLMDQIVLLDDLDIYDLSFGCPTQLRRYHQSLKETLPIAVDRGIDRETLILVEEAHTRLWQVMNEVTLLFDGLS